MRYAVKYYSLFMDDREEILAGMLEELQWINDVGYNYWPVVMWNQDYVMVADYTHERLFNRGIFHVYDPRSFVRFVTGLKSKKYLRYPCTDLIYCKKCKGWFSPWYQRENKYSWFDDHRLAKFFFENEFSNSIQAEKYLLKKVCIHKLDYLREQYLILKHNKAIISQLTKEIRNVRHNQDGGRPERVSCASNG